MFCCQPRGPRLNETEAVNKFVHEELELNPEWKFMSAFHCDGCPLEFDPKHARAFVVIFPDIQRKRMDKDMLGGTLMEGDVPEDMFFVREKGSKHDAITTMIHALANVRHKLNFKGTKLADFVEKTKQLSPLDKYDAMETLPAFDNGDGGGHSIVMFNHNGTLVHLDDRKEGPVSHGPTTDEKFFEDADKINRLLLSYQPADLWYMTMALVY